MSNNIIDLNFIREIKEPVKIKFVLRNKSTITRWVQEHKIEHDRLKLGCSREYLLTGRAWSGGESNIDIIDYEILEKNNG